MFPFGHLGIGLGLAWLLAGKSSMRIDYRLVLLGTLLPDLIDKPLGVALGLETRLWAHTLLFLFALLALTFVPGWQSLRLVGFGSATHLLLDRIWEEPRIALWPAYGSSFLAAPFSAGHWFDILFTDPYVQAGEIIGAAILLLFAARYRLLSWTGLRTFVAHGTLRGAPGSQP